MDVSCKCDSKFSSNVLIVGRTGCRKTTFIQNLAKNQMLGELKNVFLANKN